MNDLRRAVFLLLVSGVVLLAGCTQGNSGDDAASATANIPLGLDRFLLFPNPIVDASGNFQTNTNAYAQAYYAAIDPLNAKDTLAKWKAANGFDTGVGVQEFAVFRDVRDLGYGRRMTGRRNTDGSIAFVVENYHVSNVPGGYSTVNVEAARLRDTQWHVGTNAIEWSPAPCTAADPGDCDDTVYFAKFFNFDPVTGQRQNILDLDQRGQKAMPGICTNCHGGRADPLTPESNFALVENSLSRKRGDVQAKLQAFNVDSFEWSTTSPFTRAEQEAALKNFNQWVLCSYPGATSVTGTWGTCNRQPAGANEWTGTAASDIIEQAYGGAGMINARFNDVYMPANWNSHAALYRDAVVPYCRTCHILRGTASQSDIDFDDEPKFESYAQRIKTHVFDRGNMPLAFLVYQDFWESNAPAILADYIDSLAITGLTATSGGSPLRPGRPIADPGPDRMVAMGTDAILYGGDSLFAASYLWEVVAGGSASIASPTSARTTFSAPVGGNYAVRLTVTGGGQTDSKTMTVTVSNAFPDPAVLKFAHVKNVLQNVSNCDSCHFPQAPGAAQNPPIWYADFDRNYDLVTGVADEERFYREVLGRVNFTEAGNSPLLSKPSDPEIPDDINHHNGGNLFDLTDLATSGGLWNFSVIYNWILNGAPSGGVVASAGADSTGNVTFAGSPATSTVALNGSPSIGATTYAWTIQSFVPAVHPNGTTVPQTGATAATISSANSANATLNVFDIGAYVVRLAVSNGTDSDFDERSITVTESPITGLTASPGGTQALTFSGPGQTATLNLSVSTGGGSGTPQTYTWAYAPLSATDCGTINSPTSAAASITVPVAAAISGASCTLRVTASNLSTTLSDDTTITISAASGQNPSGASIGTPDAPYSMRFTVGSTAANSPSARINNVATSNIALTGSVTSGIPTLTYTWSLPSGAGTAGCSTPAAGSSTSLAVTRAGTCVVRLTVSNGILPNATVDTTVTITSAVTFATVGSTLNGNCASGCHSPGGIATPSWENDVGLHGRLAVAPFVNTGSPQLSTILRCPNEGNCGMVVQGGFQNGVDLSRYDQILTWIINGAVSSP